MQHSLRDLSVRRILIVDDDDAIREVLSGVITDEGYEVECAANGAAALTALDQMTEPPGLVFLDLMMPVMSGWEFLEAVQRDVRYAKIPIIVVSAMNAPGAWDHIEKPVDLERLLAAVARFCGIPGARSTA